MHQHTQSTGRQGRGGVGVVQHDGHVASMMMGATIGGGGGGGGAVLVPPDAQRHRKQGKRVLVVQDTQGSGSGFGFGVRVRVEG